jgi:predicted transcriptional regulator
MPSSVKLNDELIDRIKRLAEKRQRTPHWIMCEAIGEYVEREEALESFKQEALASWTAYQETGRHLKGEEVRDWLNSWGTEGEIELPECHE